MWVLRIPVCLDAACSQSMNMFASHWYASELQNQVASYDRQATQTVAFLQRAGGAAPHIPASWAAGMCQAGQSNSTACFPGKPQPTQKRSGWASSCRRDSARLWKMVTPSGSLNQPALA